MKTKSFSFVAVSLLCVAFASPLYAQAEEASSADEESLNAERPGFTNGTETVAPGHFQIESGYAHSRDGSTREHRFNDGAQLRFPLNKRSEFRIGLPAYS